MIRIALEHAISLKFMLDFEGTAPPPALLQTLAERPVGGVTLYRRRNIERPDQVRTLTDALQRAARQNGQPTLIIGADQEGGQLMAVGEGVTPFPGNMALGATRSPELAREVGAAIGRELAAMGINTNHAPVADVNTNPSNPTIGVRAFGDDPALVAEMVSATVMGIQSAGVAAAAKHFPGHGDTSSDSHYGVPVVARERAQLEQIEMVPFRSAIEAGVQLIMTAHVGLPTITGPRPLPATLSKAILTGMLRESMGFDGVIITDAMNMGAIAQGMGQVIDAMAATLAGADLLLLGSDSEVQRGVYDGLMQAARRDLIPEEAIRQSAARILQLQEWLASQPAPDPGVIGCTEHQALARRVAEEAITLVRNDEGLLPLRLNGDVRIAAVMPAPGDLTPADTSSYLKPTLAPALRAYHSHVDEFITSLPPTQDEIASLRERLRGYDLIVVGTISASMQPEQAALAQEILALGVPVITVAVRTPYDLGAYPTSKTHICTYSIQEVAMQALAAALWNKIPFCGQLPVTIPGLYSFGAGLSL